MRKLIVLLTCVAFLSCAKEPVFPEQHAQGEVKTYTLTVTAGKGESPDTRALVFEGEKLKARWTAGEQVTVYKEDVSIGTLAARYDGQSTKLDGQVTGEQSDAIHIKVKQEKVMPAAGGRVRLEKTTTCTASASTAMARFNPHAWTAVPTAYPSVA